MTATQRLELLEEAYLALLTGRAVVSVASEGKRVEYRAADASALRAEISALQALAQTESSRGALPFEF